MGPRNLKPRCFRSLDQATASAREGFVIFDRAHAVDDRLAADPGPHVFGEGAEFVADFEQALGVVDGGFDLGPIADDAGVVHQPLDVARGEAGDFAIVEPGEGGASSLLFASW